MAPSKTRDPEAKPDYKVERFGPYEVHRRLGIGGMATVHLAMERGVEGFERWVALKRLLPHLGEDEEFVRSFVREAQLASCLSHSNVVKINQLGKVGENYFISMEYIEGRDVRALLRLARRVAGPPPLTVIASLLMELLDALDYAHRKTDEHGRPLGLVHRDISPSNLLVNVNGHLKIIDFGIAKATSQKSRTQTGKIKGKLAYISPEVLRGKAPDARSDLFSVGIIAHELLTARPLFASKNDYKTIQRIQNAEVLPPSALNTNCPTELDDWVLKALTKRRTDRWGSAREMLDGLGKIIHAYHLHATPRDVASWVDWAVSLPVPQKGERQRPSKPTPRAPTIGEAEQELLDIIWGTHGGPKAPLNLDEFSARIADLGDIDLETDPAAAAPTALLFAVGPHVGHSEQSLDEPFTDVQTFAAEIESEFESTEPNGLVGPGDAEAFGTIDLSVEDDWLVDPPPDPQHDPPHINPDSALFSENELTALGSPLGGRAKNKSVQPTAASSLPDVSPDSGNFDDTEPADVALDGVPVLPPPVMRSRLSLADSGPSTDSCPTALRPVPEPSRPRTKVPPSEAPPTRRDRPSNQPASKASGTPARKQGGTAKAAASARPSAPTTVAPTPSETATDERESKKKTTLRGVSTAKPNPVEVVLLRAKKTKKRITARTTVPPLPPPEEPTVTISGPPAPPADDVESNQPPPERPRPVALAPASALASKAVTPKPSKLAKTMLAAESSSNARGDNGEEAKTNQLASESEPPPAALAPKAPAQAKTIMAPPQDDASVRVAQARTAIAMSAAEPPSSATPVRDVHVLSTQPPPALANTPAPLRARQSSHSGLSEPVAPTVTEIAPTSWAVPVLIALAVLSLLGGLAAVLLAGDESSDSEASIADDREAELGKPIDDRDSNTETDSNTENGRTEIPTVAISAIDAGGIETDANNKTELAKADLDASVGKTSRKRGAPIRARGADLPKSVRANVCIDRRGRVQSVRLLDDGVADSLVTAVTDGVSAWVYEPYRRSHKPVKACFVETVAIEPTN